MFKLKHLAPGKTKNFFSLKNSFLLATLIFFTSSCSVYMAANQPAEKDLSVFENGGHRMAVIAEFGAPIMSEEKDGKKVELYKFKQGYSTGAKTGRALFHGAADLVTLGLWELVGTPTESYASGTDMIIQVTYDNEDRVIDSQVIKGTDSEDKSQDSKEDEEY